jgi:DNA-binding transcriptional ArsR family regulator
MMKAQLREQVAILHAQFCAAFSDPSRMLIIYELREGPQNVTALAERLEMAQPVVSRHLKILRERGIIASERQGRTTFYYLTDDRVVQALDLFRAVIADQLTAQVQSFH